MVLLFAGFGSSARPDPCRRSACRWPRTGSAAALGATAAVLRSRARGQPRPRPGGCQEAGPTAGARRQARTGPKLAPVRALVAQGEPMGLWRARRPPGAESAPPARPLLAAHLTPLPQAPPSLRRRLYFKGSGNASGTTSRPPQGQIPAKTGCSARLGKTRLLSRSLALSGPVPSLPSWQTACARDCGQSPADACTQATTAPREVRSETGAAGPFAAG